MPLTLLFLVADTGGGHRSAARAVSRAVERDHPGRFTCVTVDPLGGPDSPRRLRWLVALYGPAIRLTPWLWGVLWRFSASPRHLELLRRTLFAPASRTVAAAVAAHRPAAIVTFHPMTTAPAAAARDVHAPGVPVVTVVTDLITAHPAWRCAGADRIVVPSAAVGRRCSLDGIYPWRLVEAGPPVAEEFSAGPLPAASRAALRGSLGLAGTGFLAVVTGGGEGSGGIFRRAAAIVRAFPDVHVVAICGRNQGLRRRLARLAARAGGRLTVLGFVTNMADWLACADVLVTKAGPGTIAEAACRGVPMLLTSHLPGQEEGNTEFVTAAGAGRQVATVPELLAEIGRLRRDPAAVAAMRGAAARLGRPGAAADVAALLASLTAGAGLGQPVACSQRTGAPSAAQRNGSSSSSQG
jgi:1,2-diacylglycerol 3-beta-galactosyltransferase